MTGAIYADLDEVKARVTALADCLDGIAAPGRGPIDRDIFRGLSLLTWHIVTDIDGIQRELEALDKAK
jgi:hypothetical protein